MMTIKVPIILMIKLNAPISVSNVINHMRMMLTIP